MNKVKPSKLLFVINPISGGTSKETLEESIYDFCQSHSINPNIYFTTGITEKDKENLLSIQQQYQPDAIIAVGGDGTINLVAGQLVNTPTPIGILPAGSANGLAKDLDIPENIEEALQVIYRFNIKKIDTLKINDINCFHLSDFGFNARVCHRFADSLWRGKLSYVWFGLQ
ncbi:MAG TPA: acylglycerol kinase family protein, partial [Cytophagaceae bacterium]